MQIAYMLMLPDGFLYRYNERMRCGFSPSKRQINHPNTNPNINRQTETARATQRPRAASRSSACNHPDERFTRVVTRPNPRFHTAHAVGSTDDTTRKHSRTRRRTIAGSTDHRRSNGRRSPHVIRRTRYIDEHGVMRIKICGCDTIRRNNTHLSSYLLVFRLHSKHDNQDHA